MRLQWVMIEVHHLLGSALLCVLAATMARRQLHRQMPVFFVYVVYVLAFLVVQYWLIHFGDPNWAWYSTWVDDAISIALEFAILWEIFRRLFASYEGIRRFARFLLTWSTLFLVLAASIAAIFYHEVHYSVPALSVFLVADRTLRIVQLGVILALFAVSKYLHLRWRNFTFGVAFGFGFIALMLLAGSVVRAHYGKLVAGTVNAVWEGVYCVAILIWVFYALQPEVAHIPIMSLPSHQLERWDRALANLLKRSAARLTTDAPTTR